MNPDSSISTPQEPWLQLAAKAGKYGATETLKNYEAFAVYRDLPVSERSIARVAQRLVKNEKKLQKWSSKFFWGERVAAWERRLQTIQVERKQQQDREYMDLWDKREQELIEQMNEVGDKSIAIGRVRAKLISERVVGKDGSIITRASRAKPATEQLRFGIDVKTDAIARARARISPKQEVDEYDLTPFTTTDKS